MLARRGVVIKRWSVSPWFTLPALLVSVIGFYFLMTDAWYLTGVEHAFGSTFADLRYLTATAECYRNDPSWSLETATCDPFGRPNNYPTPWVWLFAVVGASQASTELIAWLYLAAFASAIALFSYGAFKGMGGNLLRPVLLVLVSIAPASWFALERGSNEIVIFSIVAIAWLLFARGLYSGSGILLGIASVLKFFPAGAMFAFGPRLSGRRSGLISFVVVVVVGGVLTASDLDLIRQRTPQPSDAAFGAAVLVRQLGLPSGRLLGLLGLTMLTGLVMLAIWRMQDSRHKWGFGRLYSMFDHDQLGWGLVVFGGGPLIVAYVLGSNYDYRLIFAIPLVAGLTRFSDSPPARWLAILVVITAYLSYPLPREAQMIGDLLWALAVAPALVIVVIGPTVVPIVSRISGNLLGSSAK